MASPSAGGFQLRLFRPPVGVAPGHVRLVLLVSLAYLVDQYDIQMISLALKQIQEGLAIADERLGTLVALPRIGVIFALALGLWADRVGRRRLLMITILGVAAASLATALSPNAEAYVAAQIAARTFAAAEEIVSVVILAEELEADARGWGLGMMAAMGTLGSGVASLIYALVDVLPGGWRGLYGVGALAVLGLAWLRRGLPETRRFQDAARARALSGAAERAWTPFLRLARAYPGRMAIVIAVAFPLNFAFAPALTFVSKFLQEAHGFSPGDVTRLYVFGGVIPMLGNMLGGRLSDRFGRRRVFILAMLLAAGGLTLFFQTPSARVAVLTWMPALCAYFACDVLLSAFGAELFPTSYRASASALRVAAMSAAAASGFLLESAIYGAVRDHAIAIVCLLAAVPVAAIIAALGLPETARRELEAIAPER